MVLHVQHGEGGTPRNIALSPALPNGCASTFAAFHSGGIPLRLSTSVPFVAWFVRRLSAPASNIAPTPHLFRLACATHMLDAARTSAQ
jgi:hypothetical protein